MIHRIQHHARRHYHAAQHHLRNAFIPHKGNDHRPHALRHTALTTYALTIIAVKVIVSALLIVYPGPSATSNLTPHNIIQLTNKARVNNNIKPLGVNPKLNAGAQLKAQDMLAEGYFAHISPAKVTPWLWFKKAGYNYSSAGENLAIDFVNAEDVTKAWLASPGHRKNILNSRYVDIGVAVATGTLSGQTSIVVVQFFGQPIQTREQPTKVVKVTPSKPQTPAKKSSVAEAQPPPALPLASPQPSPVLSETIESPPLPPKITSPNQGVVVATARPWIGGESQPRVLVTVLRNGTKIAVTESNNHGYFSVQPSANFPEGNHDITAIAANRSGTSEASNTLNVTIDTNPPSVSLGSVVILPSYLTPGAFTILGNISGGDIAQSRVHIGSAGKVLPSPQGSFLTELTPERGEEANTIGIELNDAVGNVSDIPLASLSFFDVDVVQPQTTGFASVIPKLVFFSRKFFITFWLFLLLALAMNVIVKVRIQHRATILYSLLLLYGLTIALITT